MLIIQECVKVSKASTINIKRVVYTVPSQFIHERLTIRLYDARLEGYLGAVHVFTLNRVHVKSGVRARKIDYRHIIDSLSRKPMAFYHATLREDILPNDAWRRLWSEICQKLAPRQACHLIVGALSLAAKTNEQDSVYAVLKRLVRDEESPTLLMLQKSFGVYDDTVPEQITSDQHDLAGYDDLLSEVK